MSPINSHSKHAKRHQEPEIAPSRAQEENTREAKAASPPGSFQSDFGIGKRGKIDSLYNMGENLGGRSAGEV